MFFGFSHAEPNIESGANVDCCKLYRDNYEVRLGSVDVVCSSLTLLYRNMWRRSRRLLGRCSKYNVDVLLWMMYNTFLHMRRLSLYSSDAPTLPIISLYGFKLSPRQKVQLHWCVQTRSILSIQWFRVSTVIALEASELYL